MTFRPLCKRTDLGGGTGDTPEMLFPAVQGLGKPPARFNGEKTDPKDQHKRCDKYRHQPFGVIPVSFVGHDINNFPSFVNRRTLNYATRIRRLIMG